MALIHRATNVLLTKLSDQGKNIDFLTKMYRLGPTLARGTFFSCICTSVVSVPKKGQNSGWASVNDPYLGKGNFCWVQRESCIPGRCSAMPCWQKLTFGPRYQNFRVNFWHLCPRRPLVAPLVNVCNAKEVPYLGGYQEFCVLPKIWHFWPLWAKYWPFWPICAMLDL